MVNYDSYSYNRRQARRAEKAAPRREVAHKSNASTRTSGELIVLLIICACFIFVLFATDYISGEGLLLTWKATTAEEPDATYYAVAIDSYESVEYAAYTVPEARKLGCAGYMVKRDKYYMIAAVYPSAEDANKILTGLNSDRACILEFTAPPPEYDWCNSGLKRAAVAALEYAPIVYNALYYLSVQLDTNEKSKSEVIAELRVLYTQIDTIKLAFEQNVVNGAPFETTLILTELSVTLAMLNELKSGGLSSDGLVGDLRYVYSLIINNYCLLTAKI